MKFHRTNRLRLSPVPQREMQCQEWRGSAKIIVCLARGAGTLIELLLVILEIATLC
jgi:hypothetical protein